jgi:hypothetical protein
MGEASMLAFLDKQGDPRMIRADRFDGVAAHRTHPGWSVVYVVIRDDEEGDDVVAIPSQHAPTDFINLGLETKK